MNEQGLLVVISAPSGGGKTTIIRKVLERHDPRFVYSVSCTTRKPRQNEVDGKDYFFLSEAEFKKRIAEGEFIEWAIVHDNYYGTSRATIDHFLRQGKVVLLDIDIQGGIEVKRIYGDQALLIFIKPPSMQDLEHRLRTRQSDSDAVIRKRLDNARHELKKQSQYDAVITNDILENTVDQVIATIEKKIAELSQTESIRR